MGRGDEMPKVEGNAAEEDPPVDPFTKITFNPRKGADMFAYLPKGSRQLRVDIDGAKGDEATPDLL
jgi:hypothetical protein